MKGRTHWKVHTVMYEPKTGTGVTKGMIVGVRLPPLVAPTPDGREVQQHQLKCCGDGIARCTSMHPFIELHALVRRRIGPHNNMCVPRCRIIQPTPKSVS